jgi:transcription elongation factor S-II
MERTPWEPSLGAYVWAKLPSYPWWPGIIAPDTHGNHRRGNRFNVNFYNDTQHAWVARENLVPFAENMDKCVKPTHRLYSAVQQAMTEAIQDGALEPTLEGPGALPDGLASATQSVGEESAEKESTKRRPSTVADESVDEAGQPSRIPVTSSTAPALKRLKQKRKIPADDSDGTETAASSSDYDAVSELAESDTSLQQSSEARLGKSKGQVGRHNAPYSGKQGARKMKTTNGAASDFSPDDLEASRGSGGTSTPLPSKDAHLRLSQRRDAARDGTSASGRSDYSRQLATLRQQNAQMKARLALLERKLEKYPPAAPEPTPLTLDAIRASASGLTSRKSIGAEDLIRFARGLEASADMLSELHQAWTERCSKYRECVSRLEDLRLAAAHAAEAFELEERRIALQLAELLRYQVTLDVLRTSRAGKPIKSLGKSLSGKSAVIERLAEEIVSKWKTVVTEAQRESESGPSVSPLDNQSKSSGQVDGAQERASSSPLVLAMESGAVSRESSARSQQLPEGRSNDNNVPEGALASASLSWIREDADLGHPSRGVTEPPTQQKTENPAKLSHPLATDTHETLKATTREMSAVRDPPPSLELPWQAQSTDNSDERSITTLVTEPLPLPPGKRGDIVRALCDVFTAAATAEDAESPKTLNTATMNLFLSICIDLERAINAKFSFDFARPDYSAKYRDLKANLRRNADLRLRLLRQELAPAELVDMTAEELKTAQAREREAIIAERMLYHKQRGIPQAASTDQFRCGRCGQRACTYFQMQTRSADEPMTTFVTCMHCGNRWKC